MTRTALARTYRPRRFAELAMQEHVSETLRSAVTSGRVGHAYLFCGPRGIGKTTAARVLAMALNCPTRSPEGEPCGSCDSCERIWSGRTSLDVVEIDAASNRGVDDARELRERAMYAPTEENRWKVYIVDEAHMLTREAWNALLKILEEPPPRVIFVFATTEPQKIQQSAAPILSRCQRFDFRRISTAGIVTRLRTVLAAEGVEAEEAALVAIARRAEGGLRDALSLTDQVLALAGGSIAVGDVARVLGTVADELYLELFQLLADRRVGDVFRFVQRVLDEGHDLAEFYKGLAEALRTLIIARTDGPEALEVQEHLRQAFGDVAQRFSRGDLIRMLAHAAELDTEGRFRKSANPRTLLEAMLLSWAYLDRTLDLESILQGRPVSADVAAAARSAPAAPPAASRPAPAPPAPPAPAARPQVREPAPPTFAPSPSAVAPAAPPPQAAPPSSAAAGDAQSALRTMKAPPGMGMFLRAAEVLEDRGDVVVLGLMPGPGLERLTGESATRHAVEQALSAELGRTVRVEARPLGGWEPEPAEPGSDPMPGEGGSPGFATAAGPGMPGADPDPASTGPAATGGAAPGSTGAGRQGGRRARPAPPPRITPEMVRQEQLARLGREDPIVGAAIREWDLELLD